MTRINRFLTSVLVLWFCFVFSCGSMGFVSCIMSLLHTVWCLVRCVLQSCYVVTAAYSCVCGSVQRCTEPWTWNWCFCFNVNMPIPFEREIWRTIGFMFSRQWMQYWVCRWIPAVLWTVEYAYCVGGYQWFWGPCVDGYQRFWEPYGLRVVRWIPAFLGTFQAPYSPCSRLQQCKRTFPQCCSGTDVGSRIVFRLCNRSRKVRFSL